MAVDPFADIRCDDCGWVHFRELPCPEKLPSVVVELEFAYLVGRRFEERRREREAAEA